MLRYAISDGLRVDGSEDERRAGLLEQAARLAAQKVEFLQLREKDLAAGALAALARELLAILGTTRLLINARADVALAVRAAGVHLTSAAGELTPAQVRELYALAGLHAPVVSVSCHSTAEVLRAREHGATHILFGPVFGKQVRGEVVAPGLGLPALQSVCRAAAPVPVLALGGVDAGKTAACLEAGAAGIAGIRFFR